MVVLRQLSDSSRQLGVRDLKGSKEEQTEAHA